MSRLHAAKAVTHESRYARVERLLGKKPMHIETPIDLHKRIVEGFPRSTMIELVEGFRVVLLKESFKALNVSSRTWQRIKSETDKKLSPLDADQSARVWNLAEVLAKAEEVMGSREDAEQWLASPAIGLDSMRPIDLMETPQGAELVKTLLEQMAYGVYA